MQDGGATIAALETCRQRLEEARQHERQRLERVDRPLELERRVEALLGQRRHQRPRVVAARDRLPRQRAAPEPRRQIGRRQRRELAERAHAPPFQRRDRRDRRIAFGIAFSAISAISAFIVFVIAELLEDANRQRRQRGRLCAGIDDGDARTRQDENRRRGEGRRQRDLDAQAARRRIPRDLGANHRGRPEEPIEAADVDRDEVGARQLVARREFLREPRQRAARVVSRPR